MERAEIHAEEGKGGLVKRLMVVAALAVGVLSLTACNTTEGVGKDVKSLGKGIEETAQDAK